MNADSFNRVFDETIAKSAAVLVKKADEYADDVDRLRNFKQAAYLKDESPIDALSGIMVKHTVSIYDLMLGDKIPALEYWDEKIIDHINYLILLRALVIEELEGEN